MGADVTLTDRKTGQDRMEDAALSPTAQRHDTPHRHVAVVPDRAFSQAPSSPRSSLLGSRGASLVKPDILAERAISFGPFRLLPARRLLLEGDKRVRIGSRAFEVLTFLAEHPGEVLDKDALIARAWPGIVVEESNLKFQVSALRRALGEGNRYLVTIPGRGYSFVAPVQLTQEVPTAPVRQVAATVRPNNLPAQLTRLIGRADIFESLTAQLPRHRLMTIVGPGGIGKTSVALAVAEGLLATYEQGVWLVDLASLSERDLVASAVATVLGLHVSAHNALPNLVAGLRDKELLLVLDNCEHAIDAAAGLVARLLKGTGRVSILATSREPLRTESERVYRLPPLPHPPASSTLTAAEALAYPAVQLFVERAAASLDEFELSDADAPFAGDICRKLDGLPLAIEFAAARVEALGVPSLAAHLDDSLALLTTGRRTSPPRHRTLNATLDWSYQLLSEDERWVLRCLSIFTGSFTLEAAGAVVADADHPNAEVIEQVAELIAKSLVVAEVNDAEPRLRLLETTHAYALNKLIESGDRQQLFRRYAEYCPTVFERSAGEWPAAA